MKTIKKVKYLNADEACWYVGVDENFIDIFAKQGKVKTIGEEGEKQYDLDGLNAIKDILASDAGERMIASERRVTFGIGNDFREPLKLSVAVLASVVACVACVICVLIVYFDYGNERQPHGVATPMRTVHSEFPQALRDSFSDSIVHDNKRTLRTGFEQVDQNEKSRTAYVK